MALNNTVAVKHLRHRPSRSRCLASGAFALAMLLSTTLYAACKVSDIDERQGDRLAYDIDDSRNKLETLALSETPRNHADALGTRLAWDQTAQSLAYYATLKSLAEIHAKMKTAADQAAVAAEFSEMADVTARALKRVADYLVIFSPKVADASIAMETAKLRDDLRAFTKLFVCARAAQP